MINKKELFKKIILGILTFILIIYISFGLVFFSLFKTSEKFLNKNKISNFISNIDISDVFKNELGNEVNLIKDNLFDVGVSIDGINEFINSEDVKKYTSSILINIFDELLNNNNINYKISEDDINNLIENNINKLTINSDANKNEILNSLKNKVPKLTFDINNLIDKFSEKIENSEVFIKYQTYIYNSIGLLDILYSTLSYFIIIFIIVSFLILLIFIRRNFYKSLKWLSVSFLIPSLILNVINLNISSFVNVNNSFIKSITSIIINDLKFDSIIYFAISIIFVIINIVIYIINRYRNKKKVSYE